MITRQNETTLIVSDSKGNPIAFWRRHPETRKIVLYKVKEATLSDIENFGSELIIQTKTCDESQKS